jgi:hypothetical protein
MNSVSLCGLKRLVETGKRPDGYKVLVMNYLQRKQEFINSAKKADVDSFVEAVKLAKKIGVVWKVMK